MHAPEISVSITVYNLEKYVEKCILSILNQQFADFELIIIDDGSTDNSGEICKKYARTDERVTYIYQPNEGPSAARNRAIEASTGKYILLADGDDQLDLTMLGKLYQLCELNNADMSTCNNSLVDEKCQLLSTRKNSKEVHVMNNEAALFNLYSGKFTGYGLCNKLYRRTLFEHIRFPIDRHFEDAAIQYRLIHQANKIVMTEEQLYFYVIHSESMTRSNLVQYSEKRLDIIKNFEEAIEFLNRHNSAKYVVDSVLADYYKSLRGLALDIMKEQRAIRKEALQIVTEQIHAWKSFFLDNPYISRKDGFLIRLWSWFPQTTFTIYHLRNRFILTN